MDKKQVAKLAKKLKDITGEPQVKQTAYKGSPSIRCGFYRKGHHAFLGEDGAAGLDEQYEGRYNSFVMVARMFAQEHGGELVIIDNCRFGCVSGDDRLVRIIFK